MCGIGLCGISALKSESAAYVPAHLCDSSQGERRRSQGCAGIAAPRVYVESCWDIYAQAQVPAKRAVQQEVVAIVRKPTLILLGIPDGI